MRRGVAAHTPALLVRAGRSEGPDVEVDQPTEVARQLADMDSCAAINLGWKLVREDERAHARSLPRRAVVGAAASLAPRRIEEALELLDPERLGDDWRPRGD